MSFIFVEIIELNFCGLEKNTKRNITKREQSNDEIGTDFDINNTNSNSRDSLIEIEKYQIGIDNTEK